jgi:hypothetical protein
MSTPAAQINEQQKNREIGQQVEEPNITIWAMLYCAQFHFDSTEGLVIARSLGLEGQVFHFLIRR